MKNLFYFFVLICFTLGSADQVKEHFVLRGLMGVGDNKKAIIYSSNLDKAKIFQLNSFLFSSDFKIYEILKDRVIVKNEFGEFHNLRMNTISAISIKRAREARIFAESRFKNNTLNEQNMEVKNQNLGEQSKYIKNNSKQSMYLTTSPNDSSKNEKNIVNQAELIGTSSKGSEIKLESEESVENLKIELDEKDIFEDDDDDLIPPQPREEPPSEKPKKPVNKVGPSAEDIIKALRGLGKN
jgi:hypothetical protein